MDKHYSKNKAVQILIALLKEHNVKKVIASPGTTNIEFVGSIENDPWFEVYSSVDERSAAYLACGLAAESGETVVISCTGATASRNYYPGLTEAYYRQLPVLAITSTQPIGRAESYSPQFIDRTEQPKDTVKLSVQIPLIHSEEDEWTVNTQINKALLELRHNGGGPVHINLTTSYCTDFSEIELPKTRVIRRVVSGDSFPSITAKNVAIYVGAHRPWSDALIMAVDEFCEKNNAAVFCDHTSNYNGKYRVDAQLLCSQDYYKAKCRNVDLVIHIGSVSGAEMGLNASEVWRVNPDGVIRDTFHKLTKVFEMEEAFFFQSYNHLGKGKKTDYYSEWMTEQDKLNWREVQLPFSNTWIARETSSKIPDGSLLYMGILNSLRNWNYFPVSPAVECFSNTGGFGIDGIISSLVGASLNNPNKLCFGVLGDLSFFYDMNVVGNHIVGSNVRLLVINNGKGCEFTNYNHQGALFGEDANRFIAAAGHFGNKSTNLLKHYAEDLGYLYLKAETKEEYLDNLRIFLNTESMDKPMIFEAFTDSQDESDAIEIMRSLVQDTKGATKQVVKNLIGDKGVSTIKKLMGKK